MQKMRAWGEVLSQGEIRKEFPIAFAIGSLNKAEKTTVMQKGTLGHYMGSAVFPTLLVRNKIYCSNWSQTPYVDHKCERSRIQVTKMENKAGRI